MLMGKTQLSLERGSEVHFKGVSFAEVTGYLPLGTVSLVLCCTSTALVEPLVLTGIRVRSIRKR